MLIQIVMASLEQMVMCVSMEMNNHQLIIVVMALTMTAMAKRIVPVIQIAVALALV